MDVAKHYSATRWRTGPVVALLTLLSLISTTARATLLINEVDYDQPGADNKSKAAVWKEQVCLGLLQ